MTDEPKKTAVRVVQVTDPHLYATDDAIMRGINTDQSFSAVINHVKQVAKPDIVLLSGDLVQDESRDGYLRLKRYLDNLEVPVFSIPGNHDNPAYLEAVLSGAKSQVLGHTTFSNWIMIMLSSFEPNTASGRLSDAELDRLSNTLKRYQDRHTLICLHHHPVDMDSEWLDSVGLENAAEFWSRVDPHEQVRAVVWGHVHQSFESKRQQARLFASPSTCAQFRPKSKDFELDTKPPGYRVFELHENGAIESRVVWIDENTL